MSLNGRKKIQSGLSVDNMSDIESVVKMVNVAISTHTQNKCDIDYLINYYKGIQPILNKTKVVRPEINNKLLINHAQRITRTITGYFLGNPVQFIQSGMDKKEEVDELNKILSFEGKNATDSLIGQYQSITGTAFRMIYTDGVFKDEVPFEMKAMDPSKTFVIYEAQLAERPLAGVTYIATYDEEGAVDGYIYYVYTDVGMYIVNADSDMQIQDDYTFTFTPYSVGGVPIVEYPNNEWRIGDWELALSVMDAINEVNSGRMDDIQQTIQSLLVFLNAELNAEKYDEMRAAGVVMLKSMTNNKTDVKSIQNNLDQTGIREFAKDLENILDTIVGIPSRDNRSGGGGDTGQAVELRDGWADLEIVARNKEALFGRSEKLSLKIMLDMMRAQKQIKISLMDISVKFTRNKNHNLLVKTQSYSTLMATESLTPSDCLTIVDLVSDETDVADRGEVYWDEKTAVQDTKDMAKLQMEADIAAKSAVEPEVSNNSDNLE